MSKQSNTNSKISVDELVELFRNSPEDAYLNLISSGIYFEKKHTDAFWTAFSQLGLDGLHNSFPESTDTFNKVVWLKLFYDLNELYKKWKAECLEKVIALNPSITALTKSLFLCLELGEINSKPSNFPDYSEESLGAIKILLREITPLLKEKNQSDYSVQLVEESNNLVKIQQDIALLAEFLDAYVWADFDLNKKEDGNGFFLGITEPESKANNLYILNLLKTLVKRDFKRSESHPKISEEDHFKLNDPKWKSNEGLATVFHSSGFVVNSQTSGTTSLQVEDSLSAGMRSEDPVERDVQTANMIGIAMEQNFQYQFRQALSQIYQPNDEIPIHDYYLQIEPNVYVTLYDLVCAMSCLMAKADALRYASDFPNGSLKAFKKQKKFLVKQANPNASDAEINAAIDSYIIQSFPDVEGKHDVRVFNFVEQEILINWFRKIEELKGKTQQQLEAVLKLFSELNSPLPLNPLYKIGEQYYFSFASCTSLKFNLNRILYDHYITDKLFNHHNTFIKEERQKIGELSRGRAEQFAESVKGLFESLTPYAIANTDFGGAKNNWEFGDLEGDFDALIYFEEENLFLPIQIKLSNVTPKNEKRKEEWINSNIVESGIRQINKDFTMIQSKAGLKFIKKKMGIETGKKIIRPFIYPIIVTDNFFADHLSFPYNESGDEVYCISYFELKNLLLNQKVYAKQQDWLPFEKGKVGSQLIETIEKNIFWDFLNEEANAASFSKTLSAINEELRIEMKV